MTKISRVRLVAAPTILAMAVGLAIVEAEPAAAATSAIINFNETVGERSPNVFGGAINVLDGGSDVDSLRSVGINFVRRDAYLMEILPVTSVTQYLADLGDPLNPADDAGVTLAASWDWSKYGWVDTYFTKGINTMLVMDYNIDWLSFSGGYNGVPSNWTVYEDVVQKIYKHFAGKVKWVEAWNEPDNGFLNIAGSPYATNLAAYLDIYEHFAIGIRRESATIPLGGPSVSNASIANTWADALMTDAGTQNNVNFLTYHYYQQVPDGEGTVTQLKATAQSHNKPNMPVYVTEWNYDWHYVPADPMNDDSVDAIPYVGQRLHDFITRGADGTGYFAFNKQTTHSTFYSIFSNGTLTPKMSTYRLLSKQLGLGDGTFSLKTSSWSNGSATIVAGGAVTAAGNNVAWAVNAAPSGGDNLTFTLNGLKPGTQYSADLYEASSFRDATSVRETFTLTTDGSGTANLTFWVPFRSVVGIKLTDTDTRPDLAQSHTATANSTYGPDFAASNAVDGNDSTRWASAAGAGARNLVVDLGSQKPLNEIVVNWETAYGVDYAIQSSTDNSTWSSHVTVTGNGSAGLKAYTFSTVTARYIRLSVTAARPTYNGVVSAFSLRAYNDLARATTASATASAFYNNDPQYAPTKANDNSETTRWASANAAGTHWLQINLGSAQTVRTVRINWEAAYSQAYSIQLSPNGTTWSTPVTVTGNTTAGWHAYSFSPVANTQYVRVTSSAAVTGNVVSIWTITAH
jgi:hypothetical protein